MILPKSQVRGLLQSLPQLRLLVEAGKESSMYQLEIDVDAIFCQ